MGVRVGDQLLHDTSERLDAVCDDGIDNDGDGLVDYPDDPGCASAAGGYEGCDVDGSGVIDRNDIQAIVDGIGTTVAPGDPRDADNDGQLTIFDSAVCANQCTYEECAPPPPPCGLLGIEPVLILVGLRALRSRRMERRREQRGA